VRFLFSLILVFQGEKNEEQKKSNGEGDFEKAVQLARVAKKTRSIPFFLFEEKSNLHISFSRDLKKYLLSISKKKLGILQKTPKRKSNL